MTGINNYLLVDIGSTNIKWAIYNKKSGITYSDKVAFPTKTNLPIIYFEVDLTIIITQIINIIAKAKYSYNIKSIFISTQMHGYVLGNKAYLPLTNYISWQDERSTLVQYHDYFKDIITKAHGVDLKPNLPRISIFALSKLDQAIYKKAQVFFTLGSYVTFYLTGVNQTHITDAAASGFYNVFEKTIDQSELILPKVSYKVEIVGKYKDINIYTPVGDQQASVYGVNEPDTYILNLGTAGQLCTVSNKFIIGDFEARPYFNNETLCTVSRLFGGKRIKEYEDFNLEMLLYEDYFKALQKLPKRSKLIITGGVVKYQRKLLDKVARKLKLKYAFNEGYDSLNGLAKLAKECEDYE